MLRAEAAQSGIQSHGCWQKLQSHKDCPEVRARPPLTPHALVPMRIASHRMREQTSGPSIIPSLNGNTALNPSGCQDSEVQKFTARGARTTPGAADRGAEKRPLHSESKGFWVQGDSFNSQGREGRPSLPAAHLGTPSPMWGSPTRMPTWAGCPTGAPGLWKEPWRGTLASGAVRTPDSRSMGNGGETLPSPSVSVCS